MALNLFNELNGTPSTGGVWSQDVGNPQVIDISDPTNVCFFCATPGTYVFTYSAPGGLDPGCIINASADVTVNVSQKLDYDVSNDNYVVCRIDGVETLFINGVEPAFPLSNPFIQNISDPCDPSNTTFTVVGDASNFTNLVSLLNPSEYNSGDNNLQCTRFDISSCTTSGSTSEIQVIFAGGAFTGGCACGTFSPADVDLLIGPNLVTPTIADQVVCLPGNINNGTLVPFIDYLSGSTFETYYQGISDFLDESGATIDNVSCLAGADVQIAFQYNLAPGTSAGTPTNGAGQNLEIDDVEVVTVDGNINFDNLLTGGDESEDGVFVVPVDVTISSNFGGIVGCDTISNVFDVILLSAPDIVATQPSEICEGVAEVITLDTIYGAAFNDQFLTYQLETTLPAGWTFTGGNTINIPATSTAGNYNIDITPVITFNGEVCEGNTETIVVTVVECCPDIVNNIPIVLDPAANLVQLVGLIMTPCDTTTCTAINYSIGCGATTVCCDHQAETGLLIDTNSCGATGGQTGVTIAQMEADVTAMGQVFDPSFNFTYNPGTTSFTVTASAIESIRFIISQQERDVACDLVTAFTTLDFTQNLLTCC